MGSQPEPRDHFDPKRAFGMAAGIANFVETFVTPATRRGVGCRFYGHAPMAFVVMFGLIPYAPALIYYLPFWTARVAWTMAFPNMRVPSWWSGRSILGSPSVEALLLIVAGFCVESGEGNLMLACGYAIVVKHMAVRYIRRLRDIERLDTEWDIRFLQRR